MAGIGRFCKNLTERQRIFCEQYVLCGGDTVKAATRAGYKSPRRNAHLLLTRKALRKEIEILIDKFEAEGITFEWKLRKLKQAVETSITETEVKSAGITAIAEMNKMQGHYSADKVVTAHIQIDADIERAKLLVDRLLVEHKSEY
jgi:phage terminase small subunit